MDSFDSFSSPVCRIKAQQSAPCDASLYSEDTSEIVVLFPDQGALDPFRLVSCKNRDESVVPYTLFLGELVGTGFGGWCEPRRAINLSCPASE